MAGKTARCIGALHSKAALAAFLAYNKLIEPVPDCSTRRELQYASFAFSRKIALRLQLFNTARILPLA
jgi:hypothetical protein